MLPVMSGAWALAAHAWCPRIHLPPSLSGSPSYHHCHFQSRLACSTGRRGPHPAFTGVHAQVVRFEAFRDLVKLLQLGVAEEAGILLAEDENLDARVAAKSSAAAQAALTSGQAAGPKAPAVSAGYCLTCGPGS